MFWFLFPGIEKTVTESLRKHAKISALTYWLHVAESRSVMSNGGFASVWKAKLSWHFHLCNVHSKGLRATLHCMFLLLSNTDREENGNMNQWSHFPSHIQSQAEITSDFTSKTSLSSSNIWEKEIQRKPMFIKKWCWWHKWQHPYWKGRKELKSLCDTWLSLLGNVDFHRRWGKSV